MRKLNFLRSFYFLVFLLLLPANRLFSQQSSLIRGVDISFLDQVEQLGGVYYENNQPDDLLAILKRHSVTHIRLRIWHTPENGINGLESTLRMARRIDSAGFKLLLNFHYSDTWADPGHQTKPAAWQGLSFQTLNDSVFEYTRRVISELKAQNTLPDIVQIGNEIGCGMLWDEGRVCGSFNSPQQWSNLLQLIQSGIDGVNAAAGNDNTVKIMIHLPSGGDNAACRRFLDHLLPGHIDFDIIGLSFYPWWHGTLNDLAANCSDLASRYGQDIIIAETAYPWTLDWYDAKHNIVGDSSQLHPGYTATVEGQYSYLHDFIEVVKNIHSEKGLGFFYWEPAYISVPPLLSPWENMTLFDFQGNLLPSINSFDGLPLSIDEPTPPTVRSFQLMQNYPNPFNAETKISFILPGTANVKLTVYDALGNETAVLVNDLLTAGSHSITFNGADLPSGIYLYRLQSDSFNKARKMLLLK